MKGCNRLHQANEDPRRGGKSERKSGELKEYSDVADAEKMGVLRMNRDVQVGLLQVDGGCPQWRNQAAENRPESLHAELILADELVERAEVENWPPNAWFLLGSEEEGGGEPAGPG